MSERRDLILRLAVESYPWYRDGGALRDTWIVRLVSDADALLAACNTLEAPAQPERVCVWRPKERDTYRTACRLELPAYDIDAGPYCRCGGRIEVKP